MESMLAVALFDLAFVVPPLTVLIGAVLLALPSRPKPAVGVHPSAQAA